VDPERADESSAKLEVLLERLREAVSRGRKCLVFSQFTGLLDIVRRALERHGIGYAYLDGQTRDREKAVEEFKANPEQAVFLISLKAGGCGLNLTQSDVVFILDPWWNPAVEAQAIDRAHRMGQARHVMAYRLIGRGTVEEKIANLQDEKRRLADAVVEGAPPLEDLQWSDVEMWLSTESSADEDARRMPLD
jgi:SNF2 family DNA or RNA helicase